MSTIQIHDLLYSRRSFLILAGAVAALPIWATRVGAEPATDQAPPQMALTAKHIEQYIAGFKEINPLMDKLDAAGDKPDPKLMQTIEAAVKKHGFRDFDEYETVAVSIVAVLDGTDPQTKQYSDPVASIKQAIAEVQKDKSMSPADRRKAIQELTAELREVQPVRHKENIPLVIKYLDQLMALAPQEPPPQQ
jgi:hypothetical protein